MTYNLLHESLESFAALLESNFGLFYPKERYPELIKQLMHLLKLSTEQELFAYTKAMTQDKAFRQKHQDALIEALTVGETYYFRNGCGFNALEQIILPRLIAQKAGVDQTIRIWSAGCCRGDEPYSVAILLDELIPDQHDWNIQILGTDINRRFLEIAESGLVSEWSFRAITEQRKQKYFTKEGDNKYRLLAKMRSRVCFAYLNLAEDCYPSLENGTNGQDIILCNNTLFYFSASIIDSIIRKLTHALLPKGCLVLSSVESALVSTKELNRSQTSNIFVKEEGKLPPSKPEVKRFPTLLPRSKVISKPKVDYVSLYARGEYAQCIEYLLEVPLEEQSAPYLIRSYANLGFLDDALKVCEKAIQDDNLKPLFHFLLATLFREKGEGEKAMLELKRTLFLDKKYILAHYMLSQLCQHSQKNKEASIHRREVLRLLERMEDHAIVPQSEGMTVKQLREMMLEEK